MIEKKLGRDWLWVLRMMSTTVWDMLTGQGRNLVCTLDCKAVSIHQYSFLSTKLFLELNFIMLS